MIILIYRIGCVVLAVLFVLAGLPSINAKARVYVKPEHAVFAVLAIFLWPAFLLLMLATWAGLIDWLRRRAHRRRFKARGWLYADGDKP